MKAVLLIIPAMMHPVIPVTSVMAIASAASDFHKARNTLVRPKGTMYSSMYVAKQLRTDKVNIIENNNNKYSFDLKRAFRFCKYDVSVFFFISIFLEKHFSFLEGLPRKSKRFMSRKPEITAA